MAEDPHRPSRTSNPAASNASVRPSNARVLASAERRARTRSRRGARPRHRSERHENRRTARKHVHDDSSRARERPLVRDRKPRVRRHHHENGTHETASVRRRRRSRVREPFFARRSMYNARYGRDDGHVRVRLFSLSRAVSERAHRAVFASRSLGACRLVPSSRRRSVFSRKNVSRLERPR